MLPRCTIILLYQSLCANSIITSLIVSTCVGTDVNAMDSRGVTPLHLALSRLRIARDSDDKGGLPLSRKNEITQIVEMIHKYLHVTKSSKDETDELEKLASQLSLSETPQQVIVHVDWRENRLKLSARAIGSINI